MPWDDSGQLSAEHDRDRLLSPVTQEGADVCCDAGEDVSSGVKLLTAVACKMAWLGRMALDKGNDEPWPLGLLLRGPYFGTCVWSAQPAEGWALRARKECGPLQATPRVKALQESEAGWQRVGNLERTLGTAAWVLRVSSALAKESHFALVLKEGAAVTPACR